MTFTFQFPDRTHCQWNIEHHHFEAQYEELLETIDDLVVIHQSLDDPFAVVRWTVYVFGSSVS